MHHCAFVVVILAMARMEKSWCHGSRHLGYFGMIGLEQKRSGSPHGKGDAYSSDTSLQHPFFFVNDFETQEQRGLARGARCGPSLGYV
jgi:hypothetical protein